jgi:hypothetical protein
MPETSADINALTDFSGKRPRWLRALNQLGRPWKRFVSLDADDLLAAARKKTGLSDFGSDHDFETPMRSFLRSLDREAHLTIVGRWLARRDVFVILCNRLLIAETLRTTPAILDLPGGPLPLSAARTGQGRIGPALQARPPGGAALARAGARLRGHA